MARIVHLKTREGPQQHVIYDGVDEALKTGVGTILMDWKQVVIAGSWVLSDDGRVVQVLATGLARNGRRWARTCTGAFVAGSNKLTTNPRSDRFNFSGNRPPAAGHGKRVSNGMRIFARLLAEGVDRHEAYRQAYPKANEQTVNIRSSTLFNSPIVRQLMDQELKEAFGKVSIDSEWILKQLKDIADGSAGGKVADRVTSLRTLAAIAGLLNPQQNTGPQSGFKGFDPAQIEALRNASVALGLPQPVGLAQAEVVTVEETK